MLKGRRTIIVLSLRNHILPVLHQTPVLSRDSENSTVDDFYIGIETNP